MNSTNHFSKEMFLKGKLTTLLEMSYQKDGSFPQTVTMWEQSGALCKQSLLLLLTETFKFLIQIMTHMQSFTCVQKMDTHLCWWAKKKFSFIPETDSAQQIPLRKVFMGISIANFSLRLKSNSISCSDHPIKLRLIRLKKISLLLIRINLLLI